jgi:hypothetical protein
MSDHGNRRSPSQRFVAAAVVLFLSAAVVLRIVALDHLPGINGDEAYYGIIVQGLRAGENPPLVEGSGLPLNPFYSGLLYLIHSFWPDPSFGLLRVPALLSGLTVLVLCYPLLVRVTDRPTALATTLLLATMPVAVAYSRFGWPQSQAPLASLLALYFVLRRQLVGALAAVGAALIVHPINVFLIPVLLGTVTADQIGRLAELPADDRPRRIRMLLLSAGLLVVLAATVVVLLVPGETMRGWLTVLVPDLGRRLILPGEWWRFIVGYLDFLSGITIYRYITGPLPAWTIVGHRLLAGTSLLLLLVLGIPRIRRQGDRQALGLLAGLGVSLVAFHLLLGPRLIEPGLERYAIYLAVPSCLAAVILVRAAWSGPVVGDSEPGAMSRSEPAAAGLFIPAVVVPVCGLLLLGFVSHYFLPLIQTGGNSHRTFRTGPVEPKQAVFNAIIAAAADEPEADVLAEDWWCALPIRYLSYSRPGMQVRMCRKDVLDHIDVTTLRRRFAVGFAGGPCEAYLRDRLPPMHTSVDHSGRPVLHVWDLGRRLDLLGGVIDAAANAPPDDLPPP